MSDLLLDVQSAPTTPSAGQSVIFIDSSSKKLTTRDDAGKYTAYPTHNHSTANDPSAFATDLTVVGSAVVIPSFGFQVGSKYLFQMSASKSGAGAATPIYYVRIGTNGTAADTARATLTGPAQTAIADIGFLNILVVVRSVGAAGVLQTSVWWSHRGTAINTTTSGTGFANDSTGQVENTASGYDNSAEGGKFISISINGGASNAWTVTQACGSLTV